MDRSLTAIAITRSIELASTQGDIEVDDESKEGDIEVNDESKEEILLIIEQERRLQKKLEGNVLGKKSKKSCCFKRNTH